MKYDLIVVGAGPAGFSAAIYAARYNLKTLILYKDMGGLIATSPNIENYAGFKSLTGIELIDKMKEQAESLGVELKQEEVIEIKKDLTIKTLNNAYQSKAIVLALGSERRKLKIPGEQEFTGRGVAYCATCDAPFFKNKDVAVIGGGNASILAALLLTQYANKIYLIHNKEFVAEPINLEKAKSNKKIEFIEANTKAIKGKDFVSELVLDKKSLKVQGVFIEVGSIPQSSLAKKLKLKLNKKNEILVDETQVTNVKGIFAAGDITQNNFKQVATAVGEGAKAAYFAYQYIQKS
jgi:thioredoxin-disulfide reductase